MPYQVRDWDQHFENNKSREREQCSFVCVPNKQHGMGFCRIMSEPDGAAIYGIWHCILGACSQQRASDRHKRDGWLTSDGHQTGTAWAPDDLAIKFRRPIKEIERALEVLCSEKVAWIIKHECPPSARQVPAKCQVGALEEKGREQKEVNGIERTEEAVAALGSLFTLAESLKEKLCDWFDLSSPRTWPNDEERFIATVIKRPQFQEECAIISDHHSLLSQLNEKKYFPGSTSGLLERWDHHVQVAKRKKSEKLKTKPRPDEDF